MNKLKTKTLMNLHQELDDKITIENLKGIGFEPTSYAECYLQLKLDNYFSLVIAAFETGETISALEFNYDNDIERDLTLHFSTIRDLTLHFSTISEIKTFISHFKQK